MNLKIIRWELRNHQIGPPYYEGFSGSIHIFTIVRSLTESAVHEVREHLPRMRMGGIGGRSVESCKDLCEHAFDMWLADAGLSKIVVQKGGIKYNPTCTGCKRNRKCIFQDSGNVEECEYVMEKDEQKQ